MLTLAPSSDGTVDETLVIHQSIQLDVIPVHVKNIEQRHHETTRAATITSDVTDLKIDQYE